MKDIKVRCRTCGCVDMYETTDKYDPDVPLTGDMLQLQQPYRRYNWPVYEGALADKSTSRFRMFCTRCEGHISTTGKLDFVDTKNDNVDELIIGNTEDSALKDDHHGAPLVLTPEPTYADKMAMQKVHPSKPKKSRRK